MTVCAACGKDFAGGESCTVKRVQLRDGRTMDRVPHPAPAPCGGCGTPTGGIHHNQCVYERCPKCGEPLTTCGCW